MSAESQKRDGAGPTGLSAPPDWSPFRVVAAGEHAEAPRTISSPEGVGDRLRAAAFAELQALHAFRWAADRFDDAPDSLRRAWRALARAEERHLGWLMDRMAALGVDPSARQVSELLWASLASCGTAREFAYYMAGAEERGRKAGARFREAMRATDPISAELFGKIADEEIEHIRLAYRYFPVPADTAN